MSVGLDGSVVKKKWGRARKYGPDGGKTARSEAPSQGLIPKPGAAAIGVSPPVSVGLDGSVVKKKWGRPRKYGPDGENFDSFERKGGGSSPKIEIDLVLGRTRPNRGIEIQPASHGGATRTGNGTILDGTTVGRGRIENEPVLALNPDGEKKVGFRGNENGNGHGISAVAPVPEEKNE
ncbi:hypothetical protein SESBI_06932 [Sesbania bispinosa]|nr:hypothetical protein SESBI_06932 [Sesbania bispinosa]